MAYNNYIAHTSEGREPQTMHEHAHNVANLTQAFIHNALGADWAKVGYALGLLHDFGKYQQAFQQYLLDPTRSKAPHSAVGAIMALDTYEDTPLLARILAYCISSHHRGLYNYSEMEGRLRYDESEERRVAQSIKHAGEEGKQILEELQQIFKSSSDDIIHEYDSKDYQLLIRILFSCLVDADFLDTEAFMQPERSIRREAIQTSTYSKTLWDTLRQRLKGYTDLFNPDTDINKARAEFLAQCRRHGASSERGIYSLYLPTGGGKTLSSLAWALEAAHQHKASRIIYVIPYTSIITQTADIFRKVLGKEYILEHHASIDFNQYDDKGAEAYDENKLLSENWDMPVVVTTNVQFFESLFSNRTSRSRKLHNICNAVVVFDEVQMFPTELLSPMLRSIESLNRLCGVNLLLCTATQPIFNERLDLSHLQTDNYYAIEQEIEDVVPYDKDLFAHFRRVNYALPILELEHTTLAERLASHESVLCIVNTRKDANKVCELLTTHTDTSEVIHLSRMMCTTHLRDKIALIKQRLQQGLPTKVISTQLIEAGVDLDFPIVYRAKSGLDSIIQAGGRCNREGRRPECGTVYTFTLRESSTRQNNLIAACNATSDIISNLQGDLDPNEPSIIKDYYRKYFTYIGDFDKHGIKSFLWNSSKQKKLQFNFEDASNKFHYIEDKGDVDIFVPYGEEGRMLIESIRDGAYLDRIALRQLQGYRVALSQRAAQELLRYGRIEEVYLWGKNQKPIIIFTDMNGYSDLLGISLDNHYITDDLTF